VNEADRKTEQARKRLTETQEELSTEVSQKADKVHELAEKIGESLAKAEQLGEEGLVQESMAVMEEIDKLRKQKAEAEGEYLRT
jgi:RNA-binding protein Luc7-like 2